MIKADQILSVVRNKKSSFGKKDHLSSLGNPLNNHKLYPVLRKWKHLSSNRAELQTYHYCCTHTLSSYHNCHSQCHVTLPAHTTLRPRNARAVCHVTSVTERREEVMASWAEWRGTSHVNPEPRQRTRGHGDQGWRGNQNIRGTIISGIHF